MNSRHIQQLLKSNNANSFYHYTSGMGLNGIVTSKSIWATHINFLNDKSEFSHGKERILEVAKLMSKGKSGAEKTVWENIIQGIEHAGVNIFTASFSTNGDQLSQWRGYSSPGGCSICFNRQQLEESAQKDNWFFVPCIYDEDEKEEFITEILNELFKFNLIMHDKSKEEFDDFAASQASFITNRVAGILKNNAFREECEWRLISPPTNIRNESVKFRQGPSSIIPYYEKDLSDKSNIFKINECIIAPSPDIYTSETGVTMLLVKNNLHRDCTIRASDIPYRNW